MEIIVRQEKRSDFEEVEAIVKAAFAGEELSDQTEHLLVSRLRKSDSFIPELSMVAEVSGKLVGHILLTKIKIKKDQSSFDSLALAPVSVHPDYQGQGIGGQLILESHQVAEKLAYTSIVLLGHENYYPRFGYQRCSQFGIQLPFEAPDENCLVIALKENGLTGVNGMVEYDPAFYQ